MVAFSLTQESKTKEDVSMSPTKRTTKFRDRFSLYPSASIKFGITIEVRPSDWIYLDIYFYTWFLMVCVKKLQ